MTKDISTLSVQNLSIAFEQQDGSLLSIVDNVSFNVEQGKMFGIVGESGCGKSVTAQSLMGLLPQPYGQITAGHIMLGEQDITRLKPKQWRNIRGKRIAMIFQEPMMALNPVHKIGKQMTEMYRLHQPLLSKSRQRSQAINLLKQVGLAEPEKRLEQYPHELSGGMKQRVMIAMALACHPDVLIADEPTTALDVTVQAQILDLIKQLQKQHSMSVILITHNMGIVAQYCDTLAVMYAGKIAEQGTIAEVFKAPKHPYTRDLLAAIPQLTGQCKVPLNAIPGRLPDYRSMIDGCRYHDRCKHMKPKCKTVIPPLEKTKANHYAACIRWQEIT